MSSLINVEVEAPPSQNKFPHVGGIRNLLSQMLVSADAPAGTYVWRGEKKVRGSSARRGVAKFKPCPKHSDNENMVICYVQHNNNDSAFEGVLTHDGVPFWPKLNSAFPVGTFNIRHAKKTAKRAVRSVPSPQLPSEPIPAPPEAEDPTDTLIDKLQRLKQLREEKQEWQAMLHQAEVDVARLESELDQAQNTVEEMKQLIADPKYTKAEELFDLLKAI